jgi:hypothetical protein
MALAHRFERAEVELLGPVPGDEASNQAFDKVGKGEEEVIAAVVSSHVRSVVGPWFGSP